MICLFDRRLYLFAHDICLFDPNIWLFVRYFVLLHCLLEEVSFFNVINGLFDGIIRSCGEIICSFDEMPYPAGYFRRRSSLFKPLNQHSHF